MWRFWLTREEKRLMVQIAAGYTLKSHRNLDGDKVYRLYPPSDSEKEDPAEPTEIPYERVQSLLDQKLITTNQKFPAATFLLTNKGQKRVGRTPRGIGSIVKFDA